MNQTIHDGQKPPPQISKASKDLKSKLYSLYSNFGFNDHPNVHPLIQMYNKYSIDNIWDLLQVEIKNKNITCRVGAVGSDFENLGIFNYSKGCAHHDRWTLISCLARGLVMNMIDHSIVSLSYPKFWDLRENSLIHNSETRNSVSALSILKTSTIIEKKDGSLGNLFFNQMRQKWVCCTRGAPDSEQAKWAMKWLLHSNNHQDDSKISKISKINLDGLNRQCSYAVEIIFPQNRVIIQYPENHKELSLLAGWNIKTGVMLTQDEIDSTSMKSGFPRPHQFPNSDFKNWDDVFALQQLLSKDYEGVVIRSIDGNMWKLKTDLYKDRLKSMNMTSWQIWNMLQMDEKSNIDINDIKNSKNKINGKINNKKIKSILEEKKLQLDEEDWPVFDSKVALLKQTFSKNVEELTLFYNTILDEFKDSKSNKVAELLNWNKSKNKKNEIIENNHDDEKMVMVVKKVRRPLQMATKKGRIDAADIGTKWSINDTRDTPSSLSGLGLSWTDRKVDHSDIPNDDLTADETLWNRPSPFTTNDLRIMSDGLDDADKRAKLSMTSAPKEEKDKVKEKDKIEMNNQLQEIPSTLPISPISSSKLNVWSPDVVAKLEKVGLNGNITWLQKACIFKLHDSKGLITKDIKLKIWSHIEPDKEAK